MDRQPRASAPSQNGGRATTTPAAIPDAIEELADFLRGDFDFIPSPARVIYDVRKQLDDLTKEQRIALDVLDDSKRVIVDGGAGTGKELLPAR